MIACLESPELFYRTTVSILFCLEILTLQFKAIYKCVLIRCDKNRVIQCQEILLP